MSRKCTREFRGRFIFGATAIDATPRDNSLAIAVGVIAIAVVALPAVQQNQQQVKQGSGSKVNFSSLSWGSEWHGSTPTLLMFLPRHTQPTTKASYLL